MHLLSHGRSATQIKACSVSLQSLFLEHNWKKSMKSTLEASKDLGNRNVKHSMPKISGFDGVVQEHDCPHWHNEQLTG